MGTFSPIHWLIALLMVAPLLALLVVPVWRIFQRAGFSGAWALLMLVPMVGFLALWVLAFVKWPNDPEGRTRTNKPAIIAGVIMLPLAIAAVVAFSSSGVREVATMEQRVGPMHRQSQPQAQIDWEKGVLTPPPASKARPEAQPSEPARYLTDEEVGFQPAKR